MFRQPMRGVLGGWILCGMIIGSADVQASLLAYEGFDYPSDDDTTINGRDGGFGWNGGWIDTTDDFEHISQDDQSLDSPAFPFTPLGNRVQGTGGATRRVLGESFDLSQDGTIFASFLFRKENTGDGSARNVEFGMTTEGGGTQVVRLGSTSGHRFFLTGTGANDLGPDVEFGVTYFLVLKGVSVADGTDQFFAKVYHPSDPIPTEEPVSWDMVRNVPASQANHVLTDVRLAIGNQAIGAIDEIRVGRTFASVAIVPEPASLVLLMVGGVGLASLSRWRQQ